MKLWNKRSVNHGVMKFTYESKRIFIFRSKVSIYGELIKGWRFVNMQIVLFAEDADALESRNYATDKELFLYKLEGTI